jgi:hypothetical protein
MVVFTILNSLVFITMTVYFGVIGLKSCQFFGFDDQDTKDIFLSGGFLIVSTGVFGSLLNSTLILPQLLVLSAGLGILFILRGAYLNGY